jgi:hypothetical protein
MCRQQLAGQSCQLKVLNVQVHKMPTISSWCLLGGALATRCYVLYALSRTEVDCIAVTSIRARMTSTCMCTDGGKHDRVPEPTSLNVSEGTKSPRRQACPLASA